MARVTIEVPKDMLGDVYVAVGKVLLRANAQDLSPSSTQSDEASGSDRSAVPGTENSTWSRLTFDIPDTLQGVFYLEVGTAMVRAQIALGQRPGEDEGETDNDDDDTLMDWGVMGGESAAARQAWRKFSPRAQAVFSLLIDHPGVAMDGEELASRLNFENGRHAIAGIVAWPARHCAELGHTPPFRYQEPLAPGDSGSYWMDPQTASLFAQVRDESQ